MLPPLRLSCREAFQNAIAKRSRRYTLHNRNSAVNRVTSSSSVNEILLPIRPKVQTVGKFKEPVDAGDVDE